jgi:hypothetical protein
LKNLAQKERCDVIAAELGRSSSATAVKAHQLRLSLRVPVKDSENPDRGCLAARID